MNYYLFAFYYSQFIFELNYTLLILGARAREVSDLFG